MYLLVLYLHIQTVVEDSVGEAQAEREDSHHANRNIINDINNGIDYDDEDTAAAIGPHTSQHRGNGMSVQQQQQQQHVKRASSTELSNLHEHVNIGSQAGDNSPDRYAGIHAII